MACFFVFFLCHVPVAVTSSEKKKKKEAEQSLWEPRSVGHAYFKRSIRVDGIATCSLGR